MKKAIFLAVGLVAGLVVWKSFGPTKTFHITPYSPGDPGLFSTVLICSDEPPKKKWYQQAEETKEGGIFDKYNDDGQGRKVRYGGTYFFPKVNQQKVSGQGVILKVDKKQGEWCRLYYITRDPSAVGS